MKVILMGLLALMCIPVFATPSSTFWTPCTLDFQPANLTHITYDNYARFGNPANDGVSQFPTDYGLTGGKTLGKLAIEYGVDYLAPSAYPLFFNAKIGYPENSLSTSAPAMSLGIFNVGTKSGVTNQNIVYLVLGKSLPNNLGRLSGSYYTGNATALGGTDSNGFMIAYDNTLIKYKDDTPRVVFAADYASGKNAFGGGGLGLYYYFNPKTSLLFGPTWFNDEAINGKMKYSMQLDINF